MAAFNSSNSGDNNDGIIAAGIDKNLSDLGDCVRILKTSFDDTGIPIDDDNITFHRLCQKLEYLVGVGLKESSSVFGRTRSTWHYINACLAKSKKMHDGIRFVRGVHEVKTSAGKLRSFMRFCLVHQCLADTLQQCLMQEDITAQYYSSNSLFMKKNLTSDFLGTLYELSEVQYDLAPTGYDLDVGWPTFARKQFGNFNWNRSTSRLSAGGRSISSLAFSFTQDSQSISSFHSELTSPISPVDMTSGGGEPVSSNPTNVFNSTMTSTASTSPERSGEDDGFVSTIRQLTEEKEELAAQIESLSQQLDQERENGRNVRMRMEAERSELEEKLAVQEQQLQQQVSNPINIESLRQGEALARKMLAVRDGEVALLKAQLVSTEAKLDAYKERCTLQKTLVMEEVRKMAFQLAEAEQLVSKWKETTSKWAEMDHAEDVKLIGMDDIVKLGERLKQLLTDRKDTAKELETLKETNLSLVKALAQHGSRLSNVSYQLDQTWAWLSKIKLEASRLQTDESVMRYELKEKRALLDDLKEQLEGSRKQWEKIRASNDANQSQWQSIRDELDCRKVEEGSSEEEPEPAFVVAVPPIDLVSDIPSVTAAAAARDGREERLRLMEQQCRALYAKLANTTCRNAELVGRLATLHKQHSHNKEEETVEQHPPEPVGGVEKEIEDQAAQVEDVLEDKERQIISLREELQAVKFDLGTRQLEQEKSQQAYRRQEEELSSALDRLKENEDLIGTLQDQLYHLKSGSRDEKQSLDSQLRQLELALMTRNEECEGLVNELRSTVAELDQLRTQFKELDETVLELRMTESRLKADNQSLKDESIMLRHKIVQLVQEKDSLWKHSDKLLHLHRVQATDQWIADGSIRDCQGCQTKFTLFVRRHHCRLCGRIFCHNCSDHWLSIAASRRPERTCQECFSIHDQFSRPDAAEQLLSKSALEDVPEQTSSSTESTCAGFSVISDGEIVSSLNESSPYSVSPVHQSVDGSVKKVIRTAGIRPFESLLLAGRAVNGADQELGSAAAVPSEAFLSAAMIHRVPLLVDQPGCTLHWKFKSDPKSIAFAVVGKSDEEGHTTLRKEEESLDRVIVGTALHPSDEDFVVGSALLPDPGTYYVYFDNSYSRFSANKVTFYLSLTLPC